MSEPTDPEPTRRDDRPPRAGGCGRSAWVRSPAWLALAVALVAVLPFVPALWGPYLFDDRALVAANPYIHSLSQWPHWFTSQFWDVGLEETAEFPLLYYRPLVTASYALDWALGGGAPAVFHMTNLLWHGLCAALVFLALRRWFRSVGPALFGAAVFALHPTKAESVAWIAGRTDILCAVGILAACSGIALRRKGNRPAGIALEVAGTLFAYLTKETAMTLPLVLAVEAWFSRGSQPLTRSEISALVRVSLPQIVLAGGYLVLRTLLLPVTGHGSWNLDLGQRILLVLETTGRLAQLVLLPLHLSVQQGLVRVQDGSPIFSYSYVVAGGLTIATLTAAGWVCRRKRPAVTLGITLLVGAALPTANIVPTIMVTMVSERFLYLPLLGLAVVVAQLVQESRARRAVWVVLAGILGVCSARVALRAYEFGDAHRFWAHEASEHPESAQAIGELARMAEAEGRYDDALALYRRGQQVANRWFPYLRASREFVLSAAELIAKRTPDADHETLGALARFFGQAAESSADEPASLELPGARFSLALPAQRGERIVFELRARRAESLCYSRLGDDASAVPIARHLVAACPTCPGAVRDAAVVLARAGQYQEAFACIDALPWNRGDEVRTMIQAAEKQHQVAASTQGPAAVVARAQELAVLVAWGRAYDVLAPHQDAFRSAREIAIPFGELAWRAGHFAIAKEVLGAYLSDADLAAETHAWSLEMGWSRGEPAIRESEAPEEPRPNH